MSERFTNPQRMYHLRFGEQRRQARKVIWQVLVERMFQKFVGPADTVLDLGCGYGGFLNYIRCARRIGVDVNPGAKAALDKEIEFHCGSVLDLSFLPDACVDVVFTSNVLEHLASKEEVESMLWGALRVLRPGGHLIAMGPNLRSLPGAYWDFWDHVVPITDRSLSELLRNLGYEVVSCIPSFLPYTTCSSVPQSPWLVRLYLLVPLAWRIMGRQFLIRARKPPVQTT